MSDFLPADDKSASRAGLGPFERDESGRLPLFNREPPPPELDATCEQFAAAPMTVRGENVRREASAGPAAESRPIYKGAT